MSARVVIVSPRGARPKIDAKDGEHSILKALWGSGRKNRMTGRHRAMGKLSGSACGGAFGSLLNTRGPPGAPRSTVSARTLEHRSCNPLDAPY